MKSFSSKADRQERQEMIDLLRHTSPADLAASGRDALIPAFRRAVERVPAYRVLMEAAGIDPAQVNNMDAFTRLVPRLDKHNTFGAHRISELCLDGDLEGVRSLLTSSGHSGIFCFGVNTAENLVRSSKSIDMGLQYIFNVDQRSTLLINALPMGVKIHTRAVVLAETSVREDMVFTLVKKFSAEFEQIILVGEGSFLKKIIEEGHEQHGIDWKSLRVHLITGEEGIAENYRTYIGDLIGVNNFDDPDGKIIMSSMGIAECDLNIFHETRESVRIRRLAHANPALRKALFGTASACCPMFFVYYPHRCFVEAMPVSGGYDELVISMLSAEMKIPLLRYRSGDFGSILPYEVVVETLQKHGVDIVPDLKLPFVAVSGRGKSLSVESGNLYPEEVKEALYADPEVAAAISGNFFLTAPDGEALVECQLRQGKEPHAALDEIFLRHLARYSKVRTRVIFHPYANFSHGMTIDFERKFRYL